MIVSGPIGMHGVAVLSVREGLEFGVEIASDTAPLAGLVAAMLEVCPDLHVLRDPTRGGLAASLNEIARASGTGVRLQERAVPVPEAVANACGFPGAGPAVRGQRGAAGRLRASARADAVLAAMRAHPQGAGAALIGERVADHPGMVVAATGLFAGGGPAARGAAARIC